MLLFTVFFCVLGSGVAQARYPTPFYNEPVKVDSSGRPQYNGWEIQENNRNPQNRRDSGQPSMAPGTPIQVNPTDGLPGDGGMNPGMPIPMNSSPTQGPMPEINQLISP
jgi:hypothetical protein